MLMSEWSSDVCSSDLAHSSAPHDGASAILHAVHIVDYIAREAAARRAAPILGSPFAPPHTTFNVGRIEGGTAINIIPNECSFLWEFRTHPGDDAAAVHRRVAAFIEEEALPALRREPPAGEIETERLAGVPMLRQEPAGAGGRDRK